MTGNSGLVIAVGFEKVGRFRSTRLPVAEHPRPLDVPHSVIGHRSDRSDPGVAGSAAARFRVSIPPVTRPNDPMPRSATTASAARDLRALHRPCLCCVAISSTPLFWSCSRIARVGSAYFVVARRGKNASAPSSSARRARDYRRSQLSWS